MRYRAKLVALRSGLKAQVHAVLAKEGIAVPMTDLFGAAGTGLLDEADLAFSYRIRTDSLRDLICVFEREIAELDDMLWRRLSGDPRFCALQQIPGVGPVLATVFFAEVGDVSRFSRPAQLASWAGLTRVTVSRTPR